MTTNNLVEPGDHKLMGYAEDIATGQNPYTLSDEALNRGVSYPDTADNLENQGWGYCICRFPFYGRSCEKKRCPMSTERKLECDNNGECDTRSGLCKCAEGYYGKDCSHKRCPEHEGRVCNLQGECQTSDTLKVDVGVNPTAMTSIAVTNAKVGLCTCKFPYFGEACQFRGCPSESNTEEAWLAAQTGEGMIMPTSCSGHGLCHIDTGTCTCEEGWYGKSCNKLACPKHQGKVCNLQGTCTVTTVDESSAGSTCSCVEPFYGEACQFKRCPASKTRPGVAPQGRAAWLVYTNSKEHQTTLWGEECDGHGSCNHETGRCTCDEGYHGATCEIKDCPVVNGYQCNNAGTCITEDQSDMNLGTCHCTWPYFGPACTKKHCPVSASHTMGSWHGMNRAQECDGHGECNYDTGRCNCDAGFSGLDCTVRKGLCPMSNKNRQREWRVCNGEGTCNHETGLCHCYSEEFSGLDCSYRRCPFYPDVNGVECNAHGECMQAFDDRGQWTGVCKCHDGWSGKFCHELYTTASPATSQPPPSYTTPVHADPLQSDFVTSRRQHIILGSEGYPETHPGSNQGANVAPDINADIQTGSYQVPLTWERSAEDYRAGQHPINIAVCKLNITGCQHSVTHPEAFTGQPSGVAQPSWPQSLDSDGTKTWKDFSYSSGPSAVPSYSGVGGPYYTPEYTRVSNDVGQVS